MAVDLVRVRAVIDRLIADVDELVRARRAGDLDTAAVLPDRRAERRRGWPSRTWNSGPSAPAGAARFVNPATGAGLGRLAGRAVPARRDWPAAGLHRQPVPVTLTTRPSCPRSGNWTP
ncbi:MAG: hypothetical protein ACLP8X_18035 [Streptosporangiaceae bacterium]